MIRGNDAERQRVLPKLQKVLADAGVASRRASETLISDGRVVVNGERVTRLGVRVDPRTDVIRVDGTRIPVVTDHVYLVLNKPLGVVSTMSDPQGRPSLGDVVADRTERLFHVGRLDTDTDGLLILTNDGEFANRLAHPSFGVQKTYVAQVRGPVSPTLRTKLLAGVKLGDGPVTVDAFRIITARADKAIVEVVIHEGRKRIVRRLLEKVGHPVQRLTRTGVGPIRIGQLRPGEYRELTATELGALLDDLGL
jgi:23S rRNA pseudouridine2605 synthase